MSQNTEYTVDPSRLVSPDAAPADAAEEVLAHEEVSCGAAAPQNAG